MCSPAAPGHNPLARGREPFNLDLPNTRTPTGGARGVTPTTTWTPPPTYTPPEGSARGATTTPTGNPLGRGDPTNYGPTPTTPTPTSAPNPLARGAPTNYGGRDPVTYPTTQTATGTPYWQSDLNTQGFGAGVDPWALTDTRQWTNGNLAGTPQTPAPTSPVAPTPTAPVTPTTAPIGDSPDSGVDQTVAPPRELMPWEHRLGWIGGGGSATGDVVQGNAPDVVRPVADIPVGGHGLDDPTLPILPPAGDYDMPQNPLGPPSGGATMSPQNAVASALMRRFKPQAWY